jgi:FAD:protein FMN transferase
MKETTFSGRLFGSEIRIIIYYQDTEKAKKILDETYIEALRLQKIFNFFDKTSELSKLNNKRNLKVSPDLLRVIKKALLFSKLTEGKYDITLGKMIIQRKNKEKVKVISTSYKDILINKNNITLNNNNVLIDLGSIAKGYITDKIGDFIKSKGIKEFIIDSRGDILAYGKYSHIIGIQHPRDKENVLFLIKLQNQAIATSGDYNQFDKSFSKSHILNSQDIISATVIAPTLEEADVYSTALFVANEKSRNSLIENNKNIKVLLIKESLKPIMYNHFEDLIYEQ